MESKNKRNIDVEKVNEILTKAYNEQLKKVLGDEFKSDDSPLTDNEFMLLENSSFDLDDHIKKNVQNEKFNKIYKNIILSLKNYIDMREEYYYIVACWIIGTYFHKSFRTYPYLFFNAMKGSGKSRTLSLISYLSYNGKLVVSMSESVLFRTARDSTICIDEFEKIKGKETVNLRELLNAAYKKGIKVERARKVIKKEGEDYEIEKFDVFCPIAMANISGMDNVLGDRSITLILEKSTTIHQTRKLEIWDLEDEIRQNLDDLVSSSAELGMLFDYIEELYREWNNLLNNQHTYTTHYTHDTKLHYSTPKHKVIEYYKPLINKITNSSLNGRDLELFFPIFIISYFVNDLDNMVEIAEKITKERKEEDVYESRDVSLIEFISESVHEGQWISQKKLLLEFKDFLDLSEDERKWMSSQWFGLALKRLNLLNEKRRVGHGNEIILNISKAQEKIRMFK